MFPVEQHADTLAGYFEHSAGEVVLPHRKEHHDKGLGFSYVWKETLILVGMTAFL